MKMSDEKTEIEQLEDAFAAREKVVVESTLEAVRGVIAEASAAPAVTRSVEAPEVKEEDTILARSLRVVGDQRDARYRNLPAEQQGLGRSHEFDVAGAKYLRALASSDHETLTALRREDQHLRASLLEGDSTAGAPFDGTAGQLLPLPLANFIQTLVYNQSNIASRCNTLQSPSASLRIPIQSAASGITWTAEGGSISDGSPAYANSVSLVKRDQTCLATASNQAIADSAFGVLQWVASDVGSAMAADLDDQICNCDADTPLTGSISSADSAGDSNEVTLAVPGTIASADVVNMFFALSPSQRSQATWFGNSSVLSALSILTDGLGRPVFNMASAPIGAVTDQSGGVGAIMGRPVVEAPLTEDRLYFGNLSKQYAILSGGGVSAAVSTEYGFATNTTAMRFVQRVDGANYNPARDAYVFAVGAL